VFLGHTRRWEKAIRKMGNAMVGIEIDEWVGYYKYVSETTPGPGKRPGFISHLG
jgi:hypothetical protein